MFSVVMFLVLYVLHFAYYVMFHVCLFWVHVSGRLTQCVPWLHH